MDGCNWRSNLINSLERRDDCKYLFQRTNTLLLSTLLKYRRSTQNVSLQALLCNNSTSEVEISVKYNVYATIDGCKGSSKINIICYFIIED